ncbi:MAG: twin-arginine translocase TatA/TatE family subunit [Gemmatimonadota bacterium]
MPFGSLGIWEVLLILLVLLLVFGARRLPELGGALGKGIREFKNSVRDIEAELNKPADGGAGEIGSGQQQRSAEAREGRPAAQAQQQPAQQQSASQPGSASQQQAPAAGGAEPPPSEGAEPERG